MTHLTETSSKTIIKTFHRIKVDLNFDYRYKLIILISREVGLGYAWRSYMLGPGGTGPKILPIPLNF